MFAGPIGKNYHGPGSSWKTTHFKSLSASCSFSILLEQVVSDLSADQFYAYNIRWALTHEKVYDDLA